VSGKPPEPCAADSSVYTFKDSVRGVAPPVLVRSTLPRGGFGKVTVQGIIGKNGKVERGTLKTFGGPDIDEKWAVGDAFYWSRFYPATREGCSVRFLYRITYLGGLPQAIPEEPDTTVRR